ncbi:tail fiber domain-containing protein [Leptolyngbya sp. DQ-M1]|uniref:DUF6519 domain-containing protein n=1 Tax=Leptolyngbya sp. DQ-M1 TaxID=2933920 RepID=UPI0032975F2E
MKGDFTRSTFQPQKHYSSVRMQQGRLQLDADWNEQVDIQNHLMETQVRDIIGLSGAPRAVEDPTSPKNFNIEPTADGKDLKIGWGRIYVDGILCELEESITYATQKHYQDALKTDLKNGLEDNKDYLVYLDVWQRHITAIEDPGICEVALNGADTATRTQTIAQVKLHLLKGTGSIDEQWDEFFKSKQDRKPAIQVSTSGTLENNLYRIEIHAPGPVGTATFKWSRNNGTIVSKIGSIEGNIITISRKSAESWQSSQPDQWLEITDEAQELKGKPGTLVRLVQVFDDKLFFGKIAPSDNSNVPLPEFISEKAAKDQKLKVRRWDYTSDTTQPGIPTDSAKPIPLGNEGIQVQFGAEFVYETGDYWLIPTRAAKEIEGVNGGDNVADSSAFRPREGIHHHYCRLAQVHYQDGAFSKVKDLRQKFSPLFTCLQTTEGLNLGAAKQLAKLHVQGAEKIEKGRISPGNKPNEVTVTSIDDKESLKKEDLNPGDTIIANGQTTLITKILPDDQSGTLQIEPPIDLGADRQFRYQKPIARFSRLENNEDKTEVIITAQGRVGIGTETPTAKLSVQGQSDQSAIARFLDSTNSTRLIVAADGKVGIGTETPTEALQVRGTIETDNLKLPPQSTFEVGTLKARVVQLQEQLELVNGGALKGQNDRLFASAPLEVTGIVKATEFEGDALQFTQGSTKLSSRATGGLTIDNHVFIEKAGEETATVWVDGQVNTTNLSVTNTSTTGVLVINRSFRFSTGQSIHQISTDGRLQNANDQTLSTQLAIKAYVDASFNRLNTTLNERALLNGSNQVDFSVQNLAVDGILKLLHGADINEFSTDGRLRNTTRAVPTEQAVKTYVDTRLAESLSRLANPSNTDESAETDLTTKTLTITGNLTTTPATELQPGELARLYVQGSTAQQGNVINIGSTLVRSNAALHVGDTITLAGQSPRLITRAEGSMFSFVPHFETAPTAATLQYNQPIARFANSKGENQLMITADGLVVIGKLDSDRPVQFSTPLLETKLYVNGHIFGNNVRGDIEQLSSRTLKKNITQLSSQEVDQLLEELHPVKFNYIAEADKIRVGFISEDAPDLVASMDKKAINPLDILAILTKAIQDQRQTTLTLSYLCDRQQWEICRLQEQVKMLEQKADKKSWFG